jgi:hypothetical protein
MSVIHMDGFDSYANVAELASMQEYTTNGSVNFSTNGGRPFGGVSGGALYVADQYGNFLNKTFTGVAELWTGFAMNEADTGGTDHNFCGFASSVGNEASLSYNSTTNTIRAWLGVSSTMLGSGVVSLASAWHWIDIHFILDPSHGVFEVWVDGVRVINIRASDNISTRQNSGATTINRVMLGGAPRDNRNGLQPAYYDDWVITDPHTGTTNLGRIGDSRIVTLVPNGDAGPNNGTPDTGTTHYTQVDENQWSNAHGVTLTNTSGQEELYAMGDLSSTPASIAAVRVLGIATKSDAGDCFLETVLKSGSTTVAGTTSGGANVGQPLLTTPSYTHVSDIFEVDPNTSAPWTAAGVNAMNCGVKIP